MGAPALVCPSPLPTAEATLPLPHTLVGGRRFIGLLALLILFLVCLPGGDTPKGGGHTCEADDADAAAWPRGCLFLGVAASVPSGGSCDLSSCPVVVAFADAQASSSCPWRTTLPLCSKPLFFDAVFFDEYTTLRTPGGGMAVVANCQIP